MKKITLIIAAVILAALPLLFLIPTINVGLAPSYYLNVAGRVLAMVGFVFLFFQIVLSSKIRFIEKDVGLDKLFKVHRSFGIAGFIMIFFHPVTLFVFELIEYGFPVISILKLVGIAGMLLLILTVFVALFYKKVGMKYESWKNIHKANYAIFVIVFIHSIFLGSDLLTSTFLRVYWFMLAGLFAAILIYNIINYTIIKSHPYSISEVRQESHDTWGLFFEGRPIAHKPGQFMIVNLERGGRMSESHPFTISSSPDASHLSITPKAIGDFTATIKDTTTNDKAYVNAPYGVFSFLNYEADSYIFVVGGIGITPFISMLRYMKDNDIKKEVMLLWGNKTEADILFRDELEQLSQWNPDFRYVHVLSEQEDWQGERGFITPELLKKYVEDFADKEIFLCGPPIMMTKVSASLLGLGVDKHRIHMEEFAL